MNPPPATRRNASIVRSLQYFEAVARHKSVRLAAEELGVTQSAVSHRIRDLTKVLGEQLLTRSGRGIAITVTGQRLADKLSATFQGLQSSVEEIVGNSRTVIRVAVCSSFAPGWLIPRLGSFIDAHPAIDLQLILYATDPNLSNHVADAIVSALPVEPGYEAIHIVEEVLVAVHRPGRTGGRHRLITTDLDAAAFGREWDGFFAQSRLARDAVQDGPLLQCSHYMLALEMARAGLGVALVPDFVARRDVEAGTLAHFDRVRLPTGRTYRFCFKQTRAHEAGLKALVQWLKAELKPGPVIRLPARRSV
jgi:LysR family glycine cleavage system transcriptional activator